MSACPSEPDSPDKPGCDVPSDACLPVLLRLQKGLQALYRVETDLRVDHFIVDAQERDSTLNANRGSRRRPREQLLLSQSEDDLAIGLFVDRVIVANLEAHDPGGGLSENNFSDFCQALEGVSHFLYVVVRAAHDRPVSALELELQAEVDKYVSCVLLTEAMRMSKRSSLLRRRLYEQVWFAEDLEGDERARYRTANDQAHRYAHALERRYVNDGHLAAMLKELRLFYRLGLCDKLGHIARAA